MVKPVVIDKAVMSDRHDLVHVGVTAWQKGILPLLGRITGETTRQTRRLTTYVNGALAHIIVARVNGELIGWCSRTPGRAYVPYLFVLPPFQGQGVGGLLLNRMEAILELEGRYRVVLETPADHVRAVHFYEKQGYSILAMRSDGPEGADPLTSVRLEKRLHPYRGSLGDDD